MSATLESLSVAEESALTEKAGKAGAHDRTPATTHPKNHTLSVLSNVLETLDQSH